MSLVSKKLLAWYDRHGRDLPWRHTRDPYKILVSELMLQQTQVDRVLFFYSRWLKQYPTWKKLARATNEEVIRAWAGLGYNRRALMLRDIARTIAQHGIPKTEQEWRALKGIGTYTAAAVSAFAMNERTMPVDTNIRRVLGRFFLGVPYPQPTHDVRIGKKIDDLLPKRGRYADVPQALFDLATEICKKNPNCAQCPLRTSCKAAQKFLTGRVRIPKQMVKKAHEQRHRNKPFPDRIYRGRILKLVREQKKVKLEMVGPSIDPTFDVKQDSTWVDNMINRMIKDGFLNRKSGVITL